MRTVSKPQARTLLPLLLSLCCFSCARPANQSTAAKPSQTIPFRDLEDSPPVLAPSDSSLAVPEEGMGPARDVPFHPRNLPAGTLLSVRLNEAVSADDREAGITFTATLDEPVMLDGRTLVPRGANVAGQVESAQSSALSDRRGYLRLSLNSIDVGGRDLALSTSTLFARGTAGKQLSGSSTVRLERGRRLTFRLTEPLALSGQIAISRR